MKIAFICGALEPGYDGVGDYSRKLAVQLLKMGHQVVIVSLNDNYLGDKFEGEQADRQQVIPVLRLPYCLPINERWKAAGEYIKMFDPDWISLQYVPYSFNSKGLPFNFFSNLKKLAGRRKIHIMFHEIWLDKPVGTLKRLVALFQKSMIRSGVKSLNPNLVSASIDYNLLRLEKIKVSAGLLPLFGNIAQSQSEQCLSTGHISADATQILYFGSPPRDSFLEKVVNGLNDFCRNSAKRISIVIVGSASEDKAKFIQILKSLLGKYDVKIIDLGFLDADVLSSVISNCNVGIVRSDPYLLGKSGSAIAMLEHGIAVWLPKWDGNTEIDYTFRDHLIYSKLPDASNYRERLGYKSLLPQIAEIFVEQLNKF